MSPNLLSLLPEIILTLTGVLVMVAEPCIAPGRTRKPLGWLAILGTLASAAAAVYQHRVVDTNSGQAFTGFYNTVQVDNFSVFFHLLIAAVVLAVLLASLDYFEGPVSHAGEYFALVCFGATGMMLMTCSVELLMVFVGWRFRPSRPTSSRVSARDRLRRRSLRSSTSCWALSRPAFFLYGIALGFGATGSTSIAALAAGLAVSHTPGLALLAVVMVIVGLGFKVSAAPFHVWTPDVYQGAPAPVVALMSTAPKAAAFAVLLRFLFNGSSAMRHEWLPLILILAVASMTIGNLGALLQRDVKRLLAYSSIAHAGYLLVAFTTVQDGAVSAACFYTAAYAAMNVGAFLVLTQLAGYDEKLRSIDDFTGMALKRPGLVALLAFFLLSLIGIPFTAASSASSTRSRRLSTAVTYGSRLWVWRTRALRASTTCGCWRRCMRGLSSPRKICPLRAGQPHRRFLPWWPVRSLR